MLIQKKEEVDFHQVLLATTAIKFNLIFLKQC